MSSVVQNLIENTLGDGARATKFECFVNIPQPTIYGSNRDILTLVKTSKFPGKQHDTIDFKYKGRSIQVKGQTKYEGTWECTFYMTQDHELKKAFEDWIESIDERHNIKNLTDSVKSAQRFNSGSGYSTTMKIAQMDFHGSQDTVVYELFNVFPKSVSAVNVDYSSVGTITEFTVEFAYSYFNSLNTKTNLGTYADELKTKAENTIQTGVQAVKDSIAGIFSGITGAVKGKDNPLDTMGTQKFW